MLAKPVVEIAPRTWLISEYKLVNMYLLEGDEAALLIDCGTGIGNAAETVRELTDKPLTVAITHGHFDHDGAAALFPEIHLHPMDIKLSEEGYARGEEARAWDAKSRGPVRNPEAADEELLALGPSSSPINQSGILFYSTLFDENAACLIAFGAGYPGTVKGGNAMSKEQLLALGVNDSLVHEDVMIGAADTTITGQTKDGRTVPLFARGEWVF